MRSSALKSLPSSSSMHRSFRATSSLRSAFSCLRRLASSSVILVVYQLYTALSRGWTRCIFLQALRGTPRHMMLERGAHSNWAKNFTPDHRLDRSFDRKVYTSFEKTDARHDRVQNLR